MKLARDTWLTFQYEAGQLVRSPVGIAISLMQPITYLLLFTPFLKSVMGASSYGDAYGIYVPLLFAAMGIFSGMFAGFALVAAIRQGVIGRIRVTPLSRAGLLLGRELVFVVLTCFQAVVVVVVALIFGLRVPPINLLLALVLLAMMVLIGVSISFALAIFVPNQTALMNLTNGVTEPLALLAGVLIPLSVAPLWVQDVALWNPFAWGAKGMRAIFEGHIGAQVVWEAGIILAGLATVAVVVSSRLFNREIA
ncbi:MAG TPA: ABC transporter permease [Streptosporangiaceae bacterium]|jgi:ABC-2 type transport system permease protein|nr:ABC transporter permease [Streptosporangiaceae bacterium]